MCSEAFWKISMKFDSYLAPWKKSISDILKFITLKYYKINHKEYFIILGY